jgi:hypothetical protein
MTARFLGSQIIGKAVGNRTPISKRRMNNSLAFIAYVKRAHIKRKGWMGASIDFAKPVIVK